ncbi:hypothetical protein [Nonomuraea sp. 10N515B]|uniref:hypothetical protein n=1 Tax=Nonomuraea sp. 10N515B TaxID=3457422 RepID=UPI003FCD1302
MSPKRKPPSRSPLPPLGTHQTPESVAYTPIQQTCGCVVNWGWEPTSCDPRTFMAWCRAMSGAPCPWHGAESGQPVDVPTTAVINMRDLTTGRGFYARIATAGDIELGRRLTAELHELAELVESGPEAVRAAVPAPLRRWLEENGYDPVTAWVDQRMTDIILNRGQTNLDAIVAGLANLD